MKGAIFAIGERLIVRFVGVAIMVAFATVATSEAMSIYAISLIGTGLIQSTFDAAARQIGVGLVSSHHVMTYERRYVVLVRLAGALIGCGVFFASRRFDAGSTPIMAILAGVSVVAIAEASALGVRAIVIAQSMSRWKELASAQSAVTVLVGVCAVPAMIATESVAVPLVAMAVTDLGMAVAARQKFGGLRQVETFEDGRDFAPSRIESDFVSMSLYGLLGWGQTQADRILLALLGTPQQTAVVNFGWNATRSVSDSLAMAGVNYVRPKIFLRRDRGIAEHAIWRRPAEGFLGLIAVASVAISLGGHYVLPFFLSSDLQTVAQLVPLMAVVCVPIAYGWLLTPHLVVAGIIGRTLIIRSVTVILSGFVVIAYLYDLQLGCLIAVLRELLYAVMLRAGLHRSLPMGFDACALLLCALTALPAILFAAI